MKGKLLIAVVSTLMLSGAIAQPAGGQMGPGMMQGPGMMGPGMMGPGMMGPGMMGPGMMGPGMMGPGMMGPGMMGPGMMGPGMMQGYGGMGPGMMGPGMMGPGMMGPGMMQGYGGMGPGMHWGNTASQLNLSAEQRTKINKLEDDMHRKHWASMGQMMEEGRKLNDLYYADKRDAKAIGEQTQRLFNLQRLMIEASIEAQNEIEALLTKEQRQMLRGGPVGAKR